MIILHVLVTVLLPLRWPKIRSHFKKELLARIRQELDATYAPIPGDVAGFLLAERREVEKLLTETREVGEWLTKREESAGITGLYGH